MFAPILALPFDIIDEPYQPAQPPCKLSKLDRHAYDGLWIFLFLPRYADIDTSLEREGNVETEASKEVLEQLRARLHRVTHERPIDTGDGGCAG